MSAAEHAFDVSGYAQTTMESVATEAGISKGSIYNYFQNKQDLFEKVFASSMATIGVTVDEILAREIPASAKLESLLNFWFDQLGYHKKISRLVIEFWANAARGQQGQIVQSLTETFGAWRDRLVGLLKQGMQAGEFTGDFDVKVASSLILAILDGLMVQSMLMGIEVNEEFLAALKRSILAALTQKKENPQSQR